MIDWHCHLLPDLWGRLTGRLRPVTNEPQFDLHDLRTLGCRFQGNLGSLSGYYGADVQASARALLHAGFYDRFGTDGHHRRGLRQILQAGAPPTSPCLTPQTQTL